MERKISELLSRYETREVFDQLCLWFEASFSRPVASVAEMKMRDSTRERGRLWEEFCVAWLRTDPRYSEVWLWPEIPEEVRQALGLTGGDNGIDAVARVESGYVAIQCKYRSQPKTGRGKSVTWKELSTFVALCARTGPWVAHLVMTNGPGVTRKVARTPKDRTLAHGTFAATTRERWLKMAGFYTEHRVGILSEPPVALPSTPATGGDSLFPQEEKEKMREARLRRFVPN